MQMSLLLVAGQHWTGVSSFCCPATDPKKFVPCVQEKVEQIRQRVADTLGDGTNVALTQAIPGMLEVGRLHGIPGMLKVCKLLPVGHASVREAARGTQVGHGCEHHAVRKKPPAEACRVHSRQSGLQGPCVPPLAVALFAGTLGRAIPAGLEEGMSNGACKVPSAGAMAEYSNAESEGLPAGWLGTPECQGCFPACRRPA